MNVYKKKAHINLICALIYFKINYNIRNTISIYPNIHNRNSNYYLKKIQKQKLNLSSKTYNNPFDQTDIKTERNYSVLKSKKNK